jgi:ribosomal protein S18 acetylase RimI-like enzyme
MVRLARLEDAEAIARVQVASWHAAYRGLMAEQRLAAFTVPVRTAAWQRNLGVRGDVRTTVFEEASAPRQVVGFASIGKSRDVPGWGEIWAIYVTPEWWGRGVGSALFADAMAELAARGLPRVMLWVLEGNERAQQFYRGNGFVPDGTRKLDDGFAVLRLRREPRE